MDPDLLLAYIQQKLAEAAFTEGLSHAAIAFLLAGFVSIVSIPVIIKITEMKSLMESPDDARRSHKVPTPTFGGVAIFAGVLIGYFICQTQDGSELYATNLAIVGASILFFIGMKDDLVGIDPNKKMLFQLLSACILIFLGNLKLNYLYGIMGFHHVTDVVSILLTCFVFIAVTNAINLIDGIDGLAGGIATIASLTFGSWFLLSEHYAMATMAFALAGGLVGFLRFNFSKTSKIFMGNTGSLLIGFFLAFFAVRFVNLNSDFRFQPRAFFNAPIIAIVVLIIPIFDTLRVFMVRLLNGKSPFVADRNHMHHILLDNGLTHAGATTVLCGTSLLNTILFLFLHQNISNSLSLIILIVSFFGYLLIGSLLKMRAVFKSTHPRRRVAALRREFHSAITGRDGRRITDLL